MIVHKIWVAKRGPSYKEETRQMEGWFLFGLIPLYTRTLHLRTHP
jgi:hypothetical protein